MGNIKKIKLGGITHNIRSDAYVKPSSGIPAADIASGVIPDVSQFITKSVNDLVNYYTTSNTYTKTEVDNLIGAINQFKYQIAASTSAVTSPKSNVLYLIGPTGSGSDKYEEYVYPNSTTGWTKIGDTSIDLSGYVTTQALNTALASYTTTADMNTLLGNKVDKVNGKGLSTEDYTSAEKTKLSGIASGAQVNVLEGVKVNGTAQTITNKTVDISVPTALSQLSDDATHRVVTDTEKTTWNGKYTKPSGGIPKTDLASGAQTSLDKADSALQWDDLEQKVSNNEFVYRKSAATIKAKSLTLDRIYGKTLAWNQVAQCTATAETNLVNNVFQARNVPAYSAGLVNVNYDGAGHKIYFSIKVTSLSDNLGILASTDTQYGVLPSATINNGNTKRLSTVFTKIDDKKINVTTSTGGSCDIPKDSIQLTDLTLLYGSAIDGMTDAQILAKFESEFPGYHDYSAGKLISNDASAIETVGFNQWDEEWEQGTINSSGTPTEYGQTIRSKNFCNAIPNAEYFCNYDIEIFWYDSEKTFISKVSLGPGHVETSPSNARFFKMRTSTAYGGGPYNHDICINLSDTAKNGTYEPYWKRTMQLGLNSIKVKSHNIWDEEWESGDISGTTGENVSNQSCVRSKNYIGVIPNSTVYFKSPNSGTHLYFYNQERGFLSHVLHTANTTFTVPNNAAYMRFVPYTDYGTTYNHDICINVSSSFNGQYEPHGDTTITGGLKSAGTVKDEIVGNKYIKRVGSVDLGTLGWVKNTGSGSVIYFETGVIADLTKSDNASVVGNVISSKFVTSSQSTFSSKDNFIVKQCYGSKQSFVVKDSAYNSYSAEDFKTAMNGFYADYELDSPIEYELAEPIVPTVKAGTTEERISPNADGLSAPMVADMTYSVADYQDISGKENISNKVTSVSSSSTDKQYPTAKCLYTMVGNIESILAAI